MSQRRQSGLTQLLQINQQIADQTDRIKGMHRIAQQTNQTTGHIANNLLGQRQQINKNIELNKGLKQEIKKADRTVNTMTRRNFCIKFTLWILIIMLFAVIVGLIIWKATRKHSN